LRLKSSSVKSSCAPDEVCCVSEGLEKAAMAEDGSRSRLGRGLAALIGEVAAESQGERPRGQRRVATSSLRPNVRNPRRVFSDAELDELAASLRERGIIQPIVARAVRGVADGYEIIAGERRWRAAQRAGLHEVPVVIVEATDAEALQIAIIENVQRADLNPLEEAEGYRALIRDFSHSQDDVARMVGKSRSHVANTLRLQTLPDRVKEHIHSGRLSAGHARALIGHRDAERLAEEIVARGLNVRQVEDIARELPDKNARSRRRPAKRHAEKSADMRALEKRVSDALGLAVSINHRPRGGTLTVRYRNLDQLEDVLHRLEKKR
jgi:ParB family transcriptional regulator, chromosome partitioning protein